MAGNSTLIDAISKAMRHLGERQRVVAQNIANADTPDYKARDLAPPSFAGLVDAADGRAQVERPQVALSAAMQRMGARATLSTGTVADTDISEVKPDGNNVTLENQLLRMGKIQADYATLAGLYAKQRAMLRTALGKGGMA